MMLVHQCDSCFAISNSANDIPAGWRRILIKGNIPSDSTYELCSECSKMPMTFGKIATRILG